MDKPITPMSTTKHPATSSDQSWPACEAPAPLSLCSVEELQEIAESEGWTIEYRQIGSGSATTGSVPGACADITLLDEVFSGRFEILGETPKGHITVIVPHRGKGWVNGRSFGSEEILMVEPGVELHSLTEPDIRMLSMHIPTSLLHMEGLPGSFSVNSRSCNPIELIKPSPTSIGRLRRLIAASIYQPVADCWQAEKASDLITALASIINKFDGTLWEDKHRSLAEATRIIRLAREFIEAHLAEPIRIDQICGYCGISLSKLERTFKKELQITPSQYILARRLAAVNRALKSAKGGGKTIAQIAVDHGFSHLGRFAGAYQFQFGELPSETQRSN